MTMVAEKASPLVVELCKKLKSKALPIEDLAAALREPDVLGEALATGLIEVGRQNYTLCVVGQAVQRMTKDERGKPMPVIDEAGHYVMDKKYEVRLDGDWCWLKSTHDGRKSIAEIMSEETHEDAPPLHARLTNAGLAACRQQ
jgi:hypothetical protein